MRDLYCHRGMHLLALLSCYISSSVIVGSSKCKPQRWFESPSIQPSLREATPPIRGCVTSLHGLLQQVHVINYKSTSLGAVHTSVLVDIDPSPDRTSTRTLVVVLNSNVSIAWEVELLSPAELDISLFRFIISNSSSLEFAAGSNKQFEVVSDMDLPDGDEDLLATILQQIGGVTSYSTVHDAEELTLSTRSYEGVEGNCDLSSVRSATSAYTVEDQGVQGCFTGSYDLVNGRQIHVIELFSPKNYLDYDSPEPVEVTVQEGDNQEEGPRDTLLILVAQSPTLWRVSSTSIEGSLTIVSNTPVEAEDVHFTETTLQETSNILATKTGLLSWSEQEYGTLMSYSNIRVANQMTVYLQGPAPEGPPPPSPNELHLLSVVSCTTNSLRVIIPNEVVERHGLTPGMVTWSSTDCRGVETDQGLVLEAGIRNCSSVYTRNQDDAFTITNEVIFHSNDVSEGSGFTPEGDDEDDSMPTVLDRINVSCEFDIKSETGLPADLFASVGPLGGPLGDDVSLYLDIYTDEAYIRRIPETPYLAEVGDPLYFEMGVLKDGRLNIIMDDCWIGIPAASRYIDRIGDITQAGCPVEPSFRYLPVTHPSYKSPSPPGTVKQFTFDVPHINDHVMTYYVYCNLSLCVQSPIENEERIVPCSALTQDDAPCGPRGDIKLWPMKSLEIGPFKIPTRVERHNQNLSGASSQDCSRNSDGVLIPGYVFAVVVVISFLVGVVLVASIWIITKYTRVPSSPTSTPAANSPVGNGHIPNGHVPNGGDPPHEMQPFLQVGAVDPNRIPHEGLYNGLDPQV